ncbi:MAG: hypothetical protein CBR30_09160 [Dictyoglomus sp. NZ13-RE01]|nr:MAG: hypothetical protein CBR30_09160 [Dictyoglomus sp. NZ13-RE01]
MIKIKIFISLLVLIFLISGCSPQQPIQPQQPNSWPKTFGGPNDDVAYSIKKTSDGGYIVAGYTESFGMGGKDVYILKLDANENLIWQKTFGGSDDEWANAIQRTSDGGYIVAGTKLVPKGGIKYDYDIYILKLKSNGDLDWEKTFGEEGTDEKAFSIIETANGYIVAGSKGGDAYILKLNTNGNYVWDKTFGGYDEDDAYSIQQTSDGGYIVAGRKYTTNRFDVYVVKFDADGNKVWENTFGGSKWDEAYSIQQTSDGGYIVAGYTESFGKGWRDVYILKLDAKGNLIWQKTFGENADEWANDIQRTSDGGYIVAGLTWSFGAIASDAYILKLNADGSLIWQKTYGGSNWDSAASVQETDDGGYIVAGHTDSFGMGGKDVYILKLDKDGNTYPTK